MIINKGKHGHLHIKDNNKLYFYPEEWNRIFKAAKPRQKLNLDIQISTGARLNEAANIKVSDIDFERNNIILRVTKVKSKLKEKKPTPRIIPVSSEFTKRLRKYIRQYGLKSEDNFPMLTKAAYNTSIKKLAKSIGRDDWMDFSSHNIRKTTECWMIAVGIDGFKVAKHFGHTAKVALGSYVSADIFTGEDKTMIRDILGDVVKRMLGY
jgi:integrase